MMQAKKSGKQGKGRRILLMVAVGLVVLVLSAVIVLIVALKIGINSSFLATKIQDILNERLDNRAQINVPNAYLLLDDQFHLNLESRDIGIDMRVGTAKLEKIGRIRIAVAANALLWGKLQIAQVQLSDVNVTMAAGQGGNFLDRLPKDEAGRIDFDALSRLVFDTLEKGIVLFERQALKQVAIERLRVNFFFRSRPKHLDIANLTIRREAGAFDVAGRMQLDGAPMQLEGNIDHDLTMDETHFRLQLAQMPLHLGVEEGGLPYWEDGTVKGGHFRLKGLSDIQLWGAKTTGEQTIGLEAQLPQGEVELADISGLPASARIKLDHILGQAGLLMRDAQLSVDRASVRFHGTFAPLALPEDPFSAQGAQDLLSDSEIIALLATAVDVEGQYAFALTVDKGSVLHPTFPALDFWGEVRGRLSTHSRKVTFDRIDMQTSDTTIKAEGSLRFGAPDQGQLFIGSQTPEAIFNIQTPRISVNDIKQLWPFHVGVAARHWVLQQIESGTVLSGRLQLNLPLDFYYKGKPRQNLSENELKISGELTSVHANLVGDLPPLEDGAAFLEIRGQEVVLRQGRGQIFIDENARPEMALRLEDLSVDVNRPAGKPAAADIAFQIRGEGADMLQMIRRDPIKAGEKLPFAPTDFSGQLQAVMRLQFPLSEAGTKLSPDQVDWEGQIDFDDVALTLPLESGGRITEARGQATINNHHFTLQAQARLDGMETTIEMAGATERAAERDEKISLIFEDEARERLLPSLSSFISGKAQIDIGAERSGGRDFDVDLTQAIVEVPWLGWKKGTSIAARAQFTAYIDKANSKNMLLKNFSLKGETFQLVGEIEIRDGALSTARFDKVSLNRGDDLRLELRFEGGRYHVKVRGKKFDMRSFIKSASLTGASDGMGGEAMTLELDIDRVSGFDDEVLANFKASFNRSRRGDGVVNVSAGTVTGQAVNVSLNRQGKSGELRLFSGDGGAILRFADYYDKVQGGELDLDLKRNESSAWYGTLSLRNFEIVDEPRLARIVASPPPSGGKSLQDVAGGKINASRLAFDRAFGQIVRGENFLMLDRGVVRGPTVGATFQGVVYDAAGNVSMTGTFMPAYGLNRIFSNVPILGNILGNGRDRGLIGLTFKVDGKAKNPRIIVNPLSVIAPGVFRQIFEFHPD